MSGPSLAKRITPKLITLSLVSVAVIAAYALYKRNSDRPWTRDGQVRADVVKIGARVSGYLVNIAVKDNQAVRQGELLFQIDPSSYQLAVDQAEVGLAQARQLVLQLEAAVRAAEANVDQSKSAATTAKSQIDVAQAGVESAEAAISEAESGVISAQAMVAQTKAMLEEAKREADRAQRLAESKAGSVQTAEAKKASVDSYEAQVESATAGVQQANASLAQAKSAKRESEAQLRIANDGLEEAESGVRTALANLDQAKASLGESGEANVNIRSAKVALEQAKLNLSWTSIYAPADGFITNMNLMKDTFVSPGSPFALFVDASSFRVDAYFQETKIKHLGPGDRVMITLMGHRERPLVGKVESIGYAINPPNLAETDAPNNLVPTIEPFFDWIRLAQRVPVRVQFAEVPNDLHLVSGMTASVAIQK